MEKTILLIDDDPLVLEAIVKCLSPNYRVRVASRGRQGLELACQQPLPDLILLDVSLPDLSGFDICQALKQDALTCEIPVSFLSSHAHLDKIIRGLELGACDYVSKPVARRV